MPGPMYVIRCLQVMAMWLEKTDGRQASNKTREIATPNAASLRRLPLCRFLRERSPQEWVDLRKPCPSPSTLFQEATVSTPVTPTARQQARPSEAKQRLIRFPLEVCLQALPPELQCGCTQLPKWGLDWRLPASEVQ